MDNTEKTGVNPYNLLCDRIKGCMNKNEAAMYFIIGLCVFALGWMLFRY